QLDFPCTLDLTAAPDHITGDRRLLASALDIVLRNAKKYARSRIIITVRITARSVADQVEIVIDDDGPGIPEAEREHIFEPFYRLDRSRDRATGGFGLGLAIAQRALALHGGSIRADSSPLDGARFTITLPASA
ncbi:MAG: sensor protein RstB, partial [Massilia sp.]|nr:sensor protein RstB [Massilia sp.]